MTATPLGTLAGEFGRMSVQSGLASGRCLLTWAYSAGVPSFAFLAKGGEGWGKGGRNVTAVTTRNRNRLYS
jgi:hypothetical protein